MERKLIFDAALKMIKDGKFPGSAMSEIAFYANLTEKTVSCFFQSRHQLIGELATHIAESIRSTVQAPSRINESFQERFFRIWTALYNFYLRNPAVLAFVERSATLAHPGEARLSEATFLSPLIQFFESSPEAIKDRFNASALAIVFHGSVITAVKLKENIPSGVKDNEIRSLSEILWNGISQRLSVM